MMMPFVELASVAAERVLNAVPGGLLIAALAWLLLRVAGRQNSGTRFAVWFCALLAVAGMPFMPLLTAAAPVTQAVRSEIVLPGVWAVGIFAVWMLIATLATVRIVAGLWKLRRLRRSVVPLEMSDLPATLGAEFAAQFKSGRRVAICSSSAVTVPTAIGFFRPAILIPNWVLQELSPEELRVILLHEFAHLRRWDDWTNLAQKLVRTVFFFHPAVWWIEKRLSLEREMACDEVVLAETENPQAYAECLVSLAEKSFVRRGLALAQAVVGRARETSLRLARILDGNRPKSSQVFRRTVGFVTALAAGCFIALPDVPRLITFEDTTRTPVVVSAASVAPQLPQTTVIPAAIRTVESSTRAAAPRRSVTAGIHRTAKFSETADARQRQVEARPMIEAGPIMTPARFQEQVAALQLLFVMQTTQYDESGSAVMRLSVWRVTFDGANRQTVRQEVIARQL